MSHNNSVLSQLLKLLPRHEFERLANRHDGKRRSDGARQNDQRNQGFQQREPGATPRAESRMLTDGPKPRKPT